MREFDMEYRIRFALWPRLIAGRLLWLRLYVEWRYLFQEVNRPLGWRVWKRDPYIGDRERLDALLELHQHTLWSRVHQIHRKAMGRSYPGLPILTREQLQTLTDRLLPKRPL